MQNSLIAGACANVDVVYSGSSYQIASPVGLYQTVGGGNYYLANGSPYRGAGTLNIDQSLLSDITNKTTCPPIVYSMTNISLLGVLSPQASRDTNATLDLGYHYDPLDYVFGGCDLFSNLTFATGTAIGWFEATNQVASLGQPYGISVNTNANLSFNGNATQPCYFVNYLMVQEGGNNAWTNAGYMGGIMFNNVYSGRTPPPPPTLSANFTIWTDNVSGNFFRDVAINRVQKNSTGGFLNCEFYGNTISTYSVQSLCFTNCLFFRDNLAFLETFFDLTFIFNNCTFYNGGLAMHRSGVNSSFWQIENCSFDGTAFWWSDSYEGTNYTLFDYNAYNTNNLNWQTYPLNASSTNGVLEVLGPHSIMVTNYNWEGSWFGDFYLPANSPLIQAGSTTADQVGLYEFTTQTNQTPETNAVVDIGYHYVATDQYGNPLDTYINGTPNYIVDSQGNGLDSNGIPLWWELLYFGELGVNPNAIDPDGLTTLQDSGLVLNPLN